MILLTAGVSCRSHSQPTADADRWRSAITSQNEPTGNTEEVLLSPELHEHVYYKRLDVSRLGKLTGHNVCEISIVWRVHAKRHVSVAES